MRRSNLLDLLIWTGCAVGMTLTLVINAREQQIALLSWQTATLIGIASLVAALTYVLVRWLAGWTR